jgi:hypothetical protein
MNETTQKVDYIIQVQASLHPSSFLEGALQHRCPSTCPPKLVCEVEEKHSPRTTGRGALTWVDLRGGLLGGCIHWSPRPCCPRFARLTVPLPAQLPDQRLPRPLHPPPAKSEASIYVQCNEATYSVFLCWCQKVGHWGTDINEPGSLLCAMSYVSVSIHGLL